MATTEFRTNPKFVYIDWWQDSGLRFATNDSFDKWISEFATIIKSCTDDEDRDTGFRNGRKKIQVDFNKGKEIGRFEWMECGIFQPNGQPGTAKGKVKITYRDQPVHCRTCATDHVGRCPVREKQEVEKLVAEEARASLVKTLVIGDSNLRHVDQVGTTAKVCVSTGAKIGHTANAMKFEAVGKYENVVIHCGQNNIIVKPTNIQQWDAQLKEEMSQLSSQISKLDARNVKTVIVNVPKSELAMTSNSTKSMRNKINAQLKSIAETSNHVTIVNVNDNLNEEIDAWSDYRHYSEVMCGKMLAAVNVALDSKLLRDRMPSTTPRKYQQVHASYRLGCGVCTNTDHSEESCTKSSGKRPHPKSGSTSPPSKHYS